MSGGSWTSRRCSTGSLRERTCSARSWRSCLSSCRRVSPSTRTPSTRSTSGWQSEFRWLLRSSHGIRPGSMKGSTPSSPRDTSRASAPTPRLSPPPRSGLLVRAALLPSPRVACHVPLTLRGGISPLIGGAARSGRMVHLRQHSVRRRAAECSRAADAARGHVNQRHLNSTRPAPRRFPWSGRRRRTSNIGPIRPGAVHRSAGSGETYPSATAEPRSGREVSHWMWFIFPQVSGLGASSMSRRYAIVA